MRYPMPALLLALLLLAGCTTTLTGERTTIAESDELQMLSLTDAAQRLDLEILEGSHFTSRRLQDATGNLFFVSAGYADKYWYNTMSRTVEYPHIGYNYEADELYIPQGMFNSMAKDLGKYDLLIGREAVNRPYKEGVSLSAPKIEAPAPVVAPPLGKRDPVPTGSVQPLAGLTIVVDAGHGGKDPGGIGVNDIRENEICLVVSQKVQTQLEALGAKVIMTRSTDVFIELEERSLIANKAKADFFISIHANIGGSSAEGIETWFKADSERGSRSKQLAQAINSGAVATTKANDRGARPDQRGLHVLRVTTMPAVLIELGFMDHAKEGPRLMNESYRNKLATGIVNGVVAFAGKATDVLSSR